MLVDIRRGHSSPNWLGLRTLERLHHGAGSGIGVGEGRLSQALQFSKKLVPIANLSRAIGLRA